MKKLSIAIVLVAASVSFAKAQSTDTAKKMDNAAVQEMKVEKAAEAQAMKMDTVAPLKVEDSAVKEDAVKEEAVKDKPKTEAAKVRNQEKAKAKKVEAM